MPLETQVSVFVQNRAGALNDVCLILAEARVNIRSLSTMTEADWAIVGVVVDDPPLAVAALTEAGFHCGESHVLTVPLDNRPGELARVTTLLTNSNISIVQAHMAAECEGALLVLMTTDNKRASVLLS